MPGSSSILFRSNAEFFSTLSDQLRRLDQVSKPYLKVVVHHLNIVNRPDREQIEISVTNYLQADESSLEDRRRFVNVMYEQINSANSHLSDSSIQARRSLRKFILGEVLFSKTENKDDAYRTGLYNCELPSAADFIVGLCLCQSIVKYSEVGGGGQILNSMRVPNVKCSSFLVVSTLLNKVQAFIKDKMQSCCFPEVRVENLKRGDEGVIADFKVNCLTLRDDKVFCGESPELFTSSRRKEALFSVIDLFNLLLQYHHLYGNNEEITLTKLEEVRHSLRGSEEGKSRKSFSFKSVQESTSLKIAKVKVASLHADNDVGPVGGKHTTYYIVQERERFKNVIDKASLANILYFTDMMAEKFDKSGAVWGVQDFRLSLNNEAAANAQGKLGLLVEEYAKFRNERSIASSHLSAAKLERENKLHRVVLEGSNAGAVREVSQSDHSKKAVDNPYYELPEDGLGYDGNIQEQSLISSQEVEPAHSTMNEREAQFSSNWPISHGAINSRDAAEHLSQAMALPLLPILPSVNRVDGARPLYQQMLPLVDMNVIAPAGAVGQPPERVSLPVDQERLSLAMPSVEERERKAYEWKRLEKLSISKKPIPAPRSKTAVSK